MSLTRRAFLQQTSVILAGLGLAEVGWPRRYQRALAEPTSRKLALLVGINQYTSDAKLKNLKGCLTDLDLHRELLVHRFGFKAADIVELRNKDATVENIETAFREHLVQQARPYDVVVFHFSGYGRQVQVNPSLMDRVDVLPDTPLNALIPFDAVQAAEQVNVLLLRDLSLLLKSLPTDQIVSILDAGITHPNADELGHLRVRSLPAVALTANALRDLSLQDDLIPQLSPGEQLKQWVQRSQQLPGIVLAAGSNQQTAVEVQWHNYAAGLFTAALTHELWQAMPAKTLTFPMHRTVTDVAQPMGDTQVPQIKIPRGKSLSLYSSPEGPTADGVVITENAAWLGGISPHRLEQYQPQTYFRVLPHALEPEAAGPQYVSLISRSGFTGTVTSDKHKGPLLNGQTLQEAVRVIPTSIELSVALGKALDRVERVDATSAFSDLEHMNPVTTSDQPADYLFTKTATLSTPVEGEAEVIEKTVSSYGLCLLGGAILPGSSGDPGEAIKTAVRRLHPLLKKMLALKLLELTVNAAASRVGAIATLATVSDPERPESLVSQYTCRAPWSKPGLVNSAPDQPVVSLTEGTHIQYQIGNYSDSDLYWLLLGVNGTQAIACYPEASRPEIIADRITPGTTLTVPPMDNKWKLHGPKGFCSTYVILSRQPLTQTIAKLKEQVGQASPGEVKTLSELLEITHLLLEELNGMSVEARQVAEIEDDAGWALDMDQFATFKFFHQVV
ncbi:MAG: caspase family protein [Thermosynechococcaceae cyanobacterium]